jgi:hypothetical protein
MSTFSAIFSTEELIILDGNDLTASSWMVKNLKVIAVEVFVLNCRLDPLP